MVVASDVLAASIWGEIRASPRQKARRSLDIKATLWLCKTPKSYI